MKLSYRRQVTAHGICEERWLDLEFNITEYNTLENVVDVLIDNFNSQIYIEVDGDEDATSN